MADIEEPKKGQAVESVTEATPHPADEDSSAGPYADLSPDRPPVSTTDPQTPIAHSMIGGAGAPSPDAPQTPEEAEERAKEEQGGDVDLGEQEAEEPAAPRRGRPPKEES